MKRIVFMLSAALAITALPASAQTQNNIKRIGVYAENGEIVLGEASTALEVEITVRKEQVVVGPYARYAQKYLGVRAPLVDKTSYSIVAADVRLAGEQPAVSKTPCDCVEVASHVAGSETEFARLLPNRMSSIEQTPEAAAKQLAGDIFSLRRHRMDLITGEAGENVFGAGLEYALKKIDELEQAYLELFFGKHVSTTVTTTLPVRLSADKTSYIVARFSESGGLLPADDLSGDIVLLQITPGATVYPQSDPRGKVNYRYANDAQCTVLFSQQSLCNTILPIFEFGRTITVVAPVK
ncbi:MAG: DUF4831 family protein [Alistipes sp.]|nr:DUF4831 family protein [Alistipes sp.]